MSSYQPKSDSRHLFPQPVSSIILRERSFDAIPASLVILVAFLSITGAIWLPRATIYLAGILVMYVALRLCLVSIAYRSGLNRIRQAEVTDWYHLYKENASTNAVFWDSVCHVVIIPNYLEPDEVLNNTLSKLAMVAGAKERLIVVLAMEAAEYDSRTKGQRLIAPYVDQFADCHVTVHPTGLPGEHQCKSANLAWVGNWITRELLPDMGWNMDDVVVTTMDADTVWHPQYFAALTYYFATDKDRYRRFWQAPIRYYGGLHESHPLLRSMNAYATSVELAYLSASWYLSMPISSYSTSLRLLKETNFWDADVIADEQHMFIKAYFAQDGQLGLAPVYLPFQVNAVQGETLWQTAWHRYRQTVRHAWSSKEIGYIVSKMVTQDAIPASRGGWLLWSVAHDLVISGAGWVGVTLSTQLPVWIHTTLREEYFNRGLIYSQTILLEVSAILMALAALVFLLNEFRLRPRPTVPATLSDRIVEILGILLLPVYAVIFVTFPVLQAQFMLLFGKSLDFKVTNKI